MTEIAIELIDVSYHFAGSERPTLQSLSLAIETGEFVTFIGPSGCGKSTLLRLLAGLLTPTSGTLRREGHHDQRSGRTGFVFQHPTLLPWRTAADNIRLPLELGHQLAPAISDQQLSDLLQQVGLTPADADKRPHEMSGGMQMRLSLARALATEPSLLLLDEPFAAVDDLLRQRLQEDVRRIHAERGLTTVLVTHNLPEAVFLSDRVVVLSTTPAVVRAEAEIDTTAARNADFRNAKTFADAARKLAGLLHVP